MYTDAEIAAADTPGRATAMWWIGALTRKEHGNSFEPGQLQVFEDTLATSVDEALLQTEDEDGSAKKWHKVVLGAYRGGPIGKLLCEACEEAGFDGETKRWPDFSPMYAFKDEVFLRECAFKYVHIWPAVDPHEPAVALAA